MAKIECPSCFIEFDAEAGIIVGEVLSCPDCGVDLEVLEIEGETIKVAEAEMVEEDWGE